MQKYIYEPDFPVVSTESGKVRGYFYDGNYIFKGLPYATARRFHAPEPVPAWEGIRETTYFGYVSPLLHFELPGSEVTGRRIMGIERDACQNLNIWTTDLQPEEPKPVLVWLHGGGFSDGSSFEFNFYEGDHVTKSADCVSVSINHRLNIFGFLDLSEYGEEYYNSGNNGLLDIIAALRWIRDNIRAFGGDPNCVTLMGQSGGGGKILSLLQMPAADGLFHRAIIMSSGVDEHHAEVEGSTKPVVEAVMKAAGVTSVKELEELPMKVLAAAYNKVRYTFPREQNTGCMPFKNGEFVGDPLSVGWREGSIRVPVLLGSCFGEFQCYTDYGYVRNKVTPEEGRRVIEERCGKEGAAELLAALESAFPGRNPIDILAADWWFRKPNIALAAQRAAKGGDVYTYVFSVEFPILGGRVSWHGIDIPVFLHDTEIIPCFNDGSFPKEVEEGFAEILSSFMRTGKPALAAVGEWPPVSEGNETSLVAESRGFRLARNFDHEFIRLLQKYHLELGNDGMFARFLEDDDK